MYGGYDAGASQFAGGGFMPSPANAHDTTTSPAQSRAKGSVQTLRALTVRQIHEGTLNATDDQYRVDGEELHNITMVGRITQASEQPTHLQFTIDDGTGRIDLSYWTSGDDEQDLVAQRRADWRVGVYIRVHGHLRSFENKKSIVIFSLKVIHDFNELSFHFLQCIFQHAHLTRGQARGAGMNASKAGLPGPAAAGGSGGFGGAESSGPQNMNAVQSDCWRIFNTPEAHAKDCTTMDEMIGLLSNKYPIPAIKQAVQWLADEGHLYTTTDDSSFKSTSA